jgi:hypothetical protein
MDVVQSPMSVMTPRFAPEVSTFSPTADSLQAFSFGVFSLFT